MSNSIFKLDAMLMIGSAGANAGKTELACALIKRFGRGCNIVGIKVTAIKARDGQCPRGGQGCGVCSSLDGDFCITEETNPCSQKDTSRLLAAGARRVFWLRVMKTHLKEALTALLEVIGPGAVLICESNSLRRVVRPGLFLMVKHTDQKTLKNSAQTVAGFIDRTVVSDGERFDLDLDGILLVNGKWRLRQQATAIILAGGKSGRMGTDKALLPIKGRSMIDMVYEQLRGNFEQILISANEPEKFAFLGCRVVQDKIAGQGPLMAIASALEASANELNFVVACDIPFVDMTFVRRMLTEAEGSGAQLIIPRGSGRCEPLFAVYRRSAVGAVQQVLSAGGRKIRDVFDLCSVRYIRLDAQDFVNINTETEYRHFRAEYDD